MRSGSADARARAHAGFSYIGLLVVIALIGFALAAAGQVTRTTMKREREAELLFIGHEYRRAIARFFRQNHRYPVTLEELASVDTGGPTPQHYLRRLYRDPMTRSADWSLIAAPGEGFMGIASSSKERPLKRAGFDLPDESFEQAESYADWIFIYDPRGRVGLPVR